MKKISLLLLLVLGMAGKVLAFSQGKNFSSQTNFWGNHRSVICLSVLLISLIVLFIFLFYHFLIADKKKKDDSFWVPPMPDELHDLYD